MMLNASSFPTQSAAPINVGDSNPSHLIVHGVDNRVRHPSLDVESEFEWHDEDIVYLHWRLLKDVSELRDPTTPLEVKLDTLRWIFTEREKDQLPFSFVNCLKVVGCSPLSPTSYFGLVNADEIRDEIGCQVKTWLNATLDRYPSWVREAVLKSPQWIESQLVKNPQWINEQVKKRTEQGDLFT